MVVVFLSEKTELNKYNLLEYFSYSCDKIPNSILFYT